MQQLRRPAQEQSAARDSFEWKGPHTCLRYTPVGPGPLCGLLREHAAPRLLEPYAALLKQR